MLLHRWVTTELWCRELLLERMAISGGPVRGHPTIILVGTLPDRTCTRAIWLHEGELVLDGPASETARAYRWWAWNVAKGEDEIAATVLEKSRAHLRATLVHHGTRCPAGTSHVTRHRPRGTRANRIMTIYGTRPEAIKVAPVIRAVEETPSWSR